VGGDPVEERESFGGAMVGTSPANCGDRARGRRVKVTRVGTGGPILSVVSTTRILVPLIHDGLKLQLLFDTSHAFLLNY